MLGYPNPSWTPAQCPLTLDEIQSWCVFLKPSLTIIIWKCNTSEIIYQDVELVGISLKVNYQLLHLGILFSCLSAFSLIFVMPTKYYLIWISDKKKYKLYCSLWIEYTRNIIISYVRHVYLIPAWTYALSDQEVGSVAKNMSYALSMWLELCFIMFNLNPIA